jgi:hypothetical protein
MTKRIDKPIENITTVAFVEFVDPTSMKDAGYKFVQGLESIESIARWVMTQEPTFIDKRSEETVNGLESGWALRWQEKHSPVEYDSEYLPKVGGGFVASLAFAMSFSQQAFGQLRVSEPKKHGVIKGIRDAWLDYRSAKMKALIAACKGLDKTPKVKTPNAVFAAWAAAELDKIEVRCKTAVARGNETAAVADKVRRANAAWLTEFRK